MISVLKKLQLFWKDSCKTGFVFLILDAINYGGMEVQDRDSFGDGNGWEISSGGSGASCFAWLSG